MFSTPDDVLAYIKENDVKFVDIRFCDLPGIMQHFNVPAESVDADFFTVGQAFDGSSIRGFQAIHESDMKLIPDVATAYIDPFRVEKTLIINFSIVDPFTDEPYSRDPRNVAIKAEAYLRSTGIADTAYFGAEAGPGTPAGSKRAATSATSRASRVATSRCRRWTTSPTCATRSAWASKRLASLSSAATTKWARAASKRSTTASTRCSTPVTT